MTTVSMAGATRAHHGQFALLRSGTQWPVRFHSGTHLVEGGSTVLAGPWSSGLDANGGWALTAIAQPPASPARPHPPPAAATARTARRPPTMGGAPSRAVRPNRPAGRRG